MAEAVEGLKDIRIAAVKLNNEVLGAHLAIEDPSGDSAIFEILDGKMVVHHGKEYNVMTNDPPYDWQLVNLKQYQNFGGTTSMPGGIEGADRFVRLSYFGSFLPDPKNSQEALGYVMSAMRTVVVPFGAPYGGRPGSGVYPTWWMSFVDLNEKIYYFNWGQNPNIVWVDVDNLNFDEGSGKQFVDPKDPALVGDLASSFQPVKSE